MKPCLQRNLIAKIAMAKRPSQQILDRLNQRRIELDLSYKKIANGAFDYGLKTPAGKEILNDKKVWQILNGLRGIQNREELTALAHAVGSTAQELQTGLGETGEPVIIIGATAKADAKTQPGNPTGPAANAPPHGRARKRHRRPGEPVSG